MREGRVDYYNGCLGQRKEREENVVSLLMDAEFLFKAIKMVFLPLGGGESPSSLLGLNLIPSPWG